MCPLIFSLFEHSKVKRKNQPCRWDVFDATIQLPVFFFKFKNKNKNSFCLVFHLFVFDYMMQIPGSPPRLVNL